MFKIKIEKEITRQDIEDILCGALEGGSNSWYLINDENTDKVRNLTPELKGQPFVDRLAKVVMDLNTPVEIHDLEEEDSLLGELSIENIQRGLDLYTQQFGDIVVDEMDAGDYDALFQLMVMGEITFA